MSAGFDFEALEALDPSAEAPRAAPGAGRWWSAVLRGGELEVRVSTLGAGATAELRLPVFATVAALKARVQDALCIPLVEQRLLVGSELPADAVALRDLAPADGPLQVTAIRVVGAERVAVSGGRDGALQLWDLDRGEVLRELQRHGAAVTCVAADWPTRRALSGCGDGSLLLWDLDRGRVLQKFVKHAEEVTCLASDWKSRRALSGSRDCTLCLWDLDRGQTVLQLVAHAKPVLCVALDMPAWRAVSGGEDCSVRVWNLETGELEKELLGHETPVNCVDASVARDRAITGSFTILRLWTVHKGIFGWGGWIENFRDLHGHTSAITCVAADWEASVLLSGSADSSLRLWAWEEGKEAQASSRQLHGHDAGVTCLAVAWAAGVAVSGSHDRTLRVWDLDSGETVRELHGHADSVLCVALCGGQAA